MVKDNTIYNYGGVFIPNFYLSYKYKYLIKWCQDSGKKITKSKARSSTRPLSKTVFPLNPFLLITLIIVQSGLISIISIKIKNTFYTNLSADSETKTQTQSAEALDLSFKSSP